MNAHLYHFRLRGRVFGPATPAEMRANPPLLHAEALAVEARRVGETDWRPLGGIVNFSGPWRTAPPAGRQPLALPRFQRATVEQFIDLLRLDGTGKGAARDALKPRWDPGLRYHMRLAGAQERFTAMPLARILRRPPFLRADAWRVEVRRAISRVWVPLPSLIDFSCGWPLIPVTGQDGPGYSMAQWQQERVTILVKARAAAVADWPADPQRQAAWIDARLNEWDSLYPRPADAPPASPAPPRPQPQQQPPRPASPPPPPAPAPSPAARRLKRRGPKPAGREHWTWDEINAGRRFPRSERRVRRLAKSLGATTNPDGSIQPPQFQQNPAYHFVMGGLLILMLIVAFAFPLTHHIIMDAEHIKELLEEYGKDAGWIAEYCEVDRQLVEDWLEGRAILGELKVKVVLKWEGFRDMNVDFPVDRYLETMLEGRDNGLDENEAMSRFVADIVKDSLKEEPGTPAYEKEGNVIRPDWGGAQ